MKGIATSYYGMLKWMANNNRPLEYFPVSISATIPDGLQIPRLKLFTPSLDAVLAVKAGRMKAEDIRSEFKEHLDRHSDQVRDILQKCWNKGVVLLCYERDPKQCHRSILVDWASENLDQGILELGAY